MLRVGCNATEGRHLIVTTAVKAGDVLLTESALAAVPYIGAAGAHCAHPFALSVKATEALPDAHCRLALLLHLVAANTKTTSPSTLSIPWADTTPQCEQTANCSSDFNMAASLESHLDQLNDTVLQELSVNSAKLARLCEHRDCSGICQADLRLWLARLHANAFAITGLEITRQFANVAVENYRQQKLGLALFPLASLLNHACRPNVTVRFHGITITVRAAVDLSPNTILRHCYGPQAGRENTRERRAKLKAQYHFHCACNDCELGLGHRKLACPKCQSGKSYISTEQDDIKEIDFDTAKESACSTCRYCLSDEDLVVARKNVIDSRNLFMAGQMKLPHPDAIEMMIKAVEMRQKSVSVLDISVGEMYDSLAEVFAERNDFERAAIYSKLSLGAVIATFGEAAVETGHELEKLAQLYFNAKNGREAFTSAQQAIFVLAQHFGEEYPPVQDLRVMVTFLEKRKLHEKK